MKRNIILSLILSILVSITCVSYNANANFNDVPISHEYFEAIADLEAKGVIEDTLYFRPDDYISRAEMIQLLLRNVGFRPEVEIIESESPYEDIPEDSEFLPYIIKGYELGLTQPLKTFAPDRKVTRFEVIRILFYLEGIPVPRYLREDTGFNDISKDSFYSTYVKKALDLNLVQPAQKNIFGLFKKMTRGEFADVLYRMNIYHEDSDFYEKRPTNNDTGKGSVIIGDIPDVPKIEILSEVYSQVIKNHINARGLTKEDKDELMYAAIKAMVDKMRDEYSEYLTPEEADALRVTLNNELEGIGAYINLDNGKIIIVTPVNGSPADKAGLKAGDVILKIDGISTEGMALSEAVNRIKGKAGTSVKLLIEREGSNRSLSFEVEREKLQISSVELEMDGDIAHLTINQFSANTNFEFRQAVEDLLKANAKGIVLDLRNNPGGYLDSSVHVLGYFFDKGTLAVQVQYAERTSKHETSGRAQLKDLDVVVMGNGGSASAAEIMIGALMEHKDTPFIGEETFGKGTVQELHYFEDGSSLKLTIAKWLTPEGNWLDHKGFTPSIKTSDDPETKDKDEAYEAAKKKLQSM